MIPRCKTTIWSAGKEIVEQTVAKIGQSCQDMQALSLADSLRLGVQDQIKNKWKHIVTNVTVFKPGVWLCQF